MDYNDIINQISFVFEDTTTISEFLNEQHSAFIDEASIEVVLPSYEILIGHIDMHLEMLPESYGLPVPNYIDENGKTYSTTQVIDHLMYARIWLRNIIWKELLSKAMQYFPSHL